MQIRAGIYVYAVALFGNGIFIEVAVFWRQRLFLFYIRFLFDQVLYPFPWPFHLQNLMLALCLFIVQSGRALFGLEQGGIERGFVAVLGLSLQNLSVGALFFYCSVRPRLFGEEQG